MVAVLNSVPVESSVARVLVVDFSEDSECSELNPTDIEISTLIPEAALYQNPSALFASDLQTLAEERLSYNMASFSFSLKLIHSIRSWVSAKGRPVHLTSVPRHPSSVKKESSRPGGTIILSASSFKTFRLSMSVAKYSLITPNS